MKYGLIAGNGDFPFLVLEGARKQGESLAVVAIREETDERIEEGAGKFVWVGIGQLGKMISFLKDEGVTKVIMAGAGQTRPAFFRRRARRADAENVVESSSAKY